MRLLAAIELGSVWMLGWLGAAAIPIALHLLHRRRQQEVSWAAMELLMQAIQQHSRTLRIEGWLLLLLRTLALVLFALALARPLMRGGQASEVITAQPPRLCVLVMDTSYSMGYKAGRESLWQRAQSFATAQVQQAGSNDGFLLIQLGEPSQAIIAQPAYDANRVLSEIGRLKVTDGGADLPGCVQTIQQALQDAGSVIVESSDVEIVFITDMGRDTWQAALDGDAKRGLQELSIKYSVRIESVAPQQPQNVAITAFETDSSIVLQGRQLRCTATIQNFGTDTLTRLPVQFQSDGATSQTEFVDCPPGQARTVVAELPSPNNRSWNLSVVLPEDRLLVDNRRDLIISIRPQIRVVTVEESAGAARLVNLSLAPIGSSEGRNKSGRALTVDTWNPLELQSRSLAEVGAVVLVDIGDLSNNAVNRLRTFVYAGGSLLVLVGPRTQAARWNHTADSLSTLCGFQLLEPSALGDWRIDPLNYVSPIAKPFANFLDAGLLTTPIFRYWKINRTATVPEQSTSLITDLALSSGDPWLVRRSLGEGWVGVMLSAPQSGSSTRASDEPWNAIATWPSFVPIMQKSMETLIGGSDSLQNLTVGQALSGSLPQTSQSVELTIQRPDQSQARVAVAQSASGSRRGWSYNATDRAGVYSVTTNILDDQADEANKQTQAYAVNIQPTQSDLISLNAAAITLNSPTPSTKERTRQPEELNDREDEWLVRMALLALLLVLIGESLLAWHLGRRI